MGCGCTGKKQGKRRDAARRLAFEYARRVAGVVVFYRCADYDFAEIENFDANEKAEVEYLI
jgi:hypothetical protein